MASQTATDHRIERRPKLSESVVAAIRKQLLAGEILPGQKLPTEGQLTETFGVSRTVIREALAELAADGLVEPRQGAGVFVIEHISTAFGALASEMGTKDSIALNVLEVRLAIEIESAGLAAVRRNAAQEAAIQEAFFEFERLLLDSQPTGPADLAFHRAIAAPPTIRSTSRCSTCSAAAPSPATSPRPGRPTRAVRRVPARAAARAPGDPQRHFGRRRRGRPQRHAGASAASQKRYRERLQAGSASTAKVPPTPRANDASATASGLP